MDFETKRVLISKILEVTGRIAKVETGGEKEALLRDRLRAVIDETLAEDWVVAVKQVTILLSDLRGFTALSEKHSAITIVGLLNRYFARMSEIIIQFGGTIDKFMGDAIMVLFGAPDESCDDVERALACAIEMQRAMDEVNETSKKIGMPPLFMGIGVNTGSVVAGTLGSDLHSEYTVIGDQVNLASRVESHSLRGQILISENTYRLASEFVTVGNENQVHVKGKRDPVKMYELLSTSRPVALTAPRREARRSARVLVDTPLTFQVVRDKTVEPEAIEGRVVDISYGGLFAVLPIHLETNSEIKISLSLSLLGSESRDVYAKVLRVNEFQGKYEVNMEFTSIDPEGEAALKAFIDREIASR